ncbi:MAG: DUF1786 domain-containing protein, partial [Thermomicrobiales bacterium]
MTEQSSADILAVDVGAGTQDILIYDPARTPENSFKLVLPSQTQIVASRVRAMTRAGAAIHLSGHLMGGGASSEAILAHVQAGLTVTAEPSAAATIHNDLRRVEARGVVLVDEAPAGAEVIRTEDIDLHALSSTLSLYDVPMPGQIAVAIQDHGFRPGTGNNEMRFDYLQSLLDDGGDLSNMVFDSAPPGMTRMAAVLESIGHGIVMDTGAAAVLGALGDPIVRHYAQTQGVILVNVGNMHTFATLLRGRRLFGLFEHHTGGITPEIISRLVTDLQRGNLDPATFRERFDGHGAAIHPDYLRGSPFSFVAITGPNRALAR